MRFLRDERVIVQYRGVAERGRVTGVMPRLRRVVTDSGRRLVVPVRRLRPSPDRVLILEARLDRSLRSNRTYGPMLQHWLSAYDVTALYERVHTVKDIQRFLGREGREAGTRIIHIIGHGTRVRPGRRVVLELTHERLDLVENARIFAGLVGKVIVFSCCNIGSDRKSMEAVKAASGAAAVIAYRVEVNDSYTNLAEALLYDRLINTNLSPARAVELVGEVLKQAGVKVSGVVTRKPVLVCV